MFAVCEDVKIALSVEQNYSLNWDLESRDETQGSLAVLRLEEVEAESERNSPP